MAMMGQGPWAPAQEAFNKFARMDRRLAVQLGQLSKAQAHDDKLAWALESGRIYGMRQYRCQAILRKELARDWRHPPVEEPW
jgi:hypothetical protein